MTPLYFFSPQNKKFHPKNTSPHTSCLGNSVSIHLICQKKVMRFTEDYFLLKEHFTLDAEKIILPGSEIMITNYDFEATPPSNANNSDEEGSLETDTTPSEFTFRYSIFSKKDCEPSSKAIVLLLGLNEKQSDKYLCWAKNLVETTNKPVILFPVLFPIGRNWNKLQERRVNSITKNKNGLYQSTSVKTLNKKLILSQRVKDLPERVTLSGFRSICDIVKLTVELKEGNHPLFTKGTSVDIFGYSIGAFIAQVILLANPRNLFEKSKFFLFCGGSFFNTIVENSRISMDQTALKKLQTFYDREIREKYGHAKKYLDNLSFENINLAFKTMLSVEKFKRFREKVFKQFSNQIHVIALAKDSFMAPEHIYTSLRGEGGIIPVSVNVLDYPYSYTHETPFPISNDPELNSTIDSCFNSTFTMVANFLRDR